MKTKLAILALGLMIAGAAAQATPITGFDCWTFGMTPDQVKGCSQYGPYKDVKITGGLETANGRFEGAKTNVSFVFQNGHLAKIQVWLCEQTDLDTAVASLAKARQYMAKAVGPVALDGIQVPADLTPKKFEERVRTLAATALPADEPGKIQLNPVHQPEGALVWTSAFRHPRFGYYVFLYFAQPTAPTPIPH